jgi:hypothetical protein
MSVVWDIEATDLDYSRERGGVGTYWVHIARFSLGEEEEKKPTLIDSLTVLPLVCPKILYPIIA